MKPIKLSICICSMHSRSAKFLQLMWCLQRQRRIEEVQILVSIDERFLSVGAKRNSLVRNALGEYVAHIDDDDLVHPEYVSKILDAIDANPGVDAIVLRGQRIDVLNKYPRCSFDYCLMRPDLAETDKLGVLWRSPGHLCPIRADIARSVPFIEARNEPEDLVWVEQLDTRVKTAARAGEPGEILYYYLWNSEDNSLSQYRNAKEKEAECKK